MVRSTDVKPLGRFEASDEVIQLRNKLCKMRGIEPPPLTIENNLECATYSIMCDPNCVKLEHIVDVKYKTYLTDNELFPFESTMKRIILDQLEPEKCATEFDKKRLELARASYALRRAAIEEVPVKIREKVFVEFLVLARNRVQYKMPLRYLLEWLEEITSDMTKQQIEKKLKNVEERFIRKNGFKETTDYEKNKRDGIVLHYHVIKHMCLLIRSRYSRAIAEYFTQLHWDYIALLRASEECFQEAISVLNKQLDTYEQQNKNIIKDLQKYNKSLEIYKDLLKTIQKNKAKFEALDELHDEAKCKVEDRRLLFQAIDNGNILSLHKFNMFQMAIAKGRNAWKPFRICLIRDINDYEGNIECHEDWFYLPFDKLSTTSSKNVDFDEYTELYPHRTHALAIRYHDISDVLALKQYLDKGCLSDNELFELNSDFLCEDKSENKTNTTEQKEYDGFFEKDSLRNNVYKIKLIVIRSFFFKRYILRKQNVIQ